MEMIRLLVVAFALAVAGMAQMDSPVYYSVPGADAPELAVRGKYSVGVRTVDMVHTQQVDILHFDKETGKAPLYDRLLKVEIWYPAVLPPGVAERVVYRSPLPGGSGKSFEFAGKAARDAAPMVGQKFPLVVVSHGYPGSRTFLTYLTENLASKGYVVAAIDHTDSVFGDIKPFQSTLLNRSTDQLFVLDTIDARSNEAGSFLNGMVDASRAAIVGYSMGGYGALASAGAGYSKNAAVQAVIPGGYFDAITAGDPRFEARRHENLKAIVAMAPWGNQPPYNVWDKQGLAGIRIPSLFIVGDQDDVSGYDPGVKPAFENAVHSDRCMLVYENARHNVGGNPPPPGVALDFTALQSFEEPTWRKDRIAAINQHFVTAFLDLYLKGDETRRAYLHLPVEKSNEGVWEKNYWKGFQKRWATGLEMHCAAPAGN